MKKKGLDKALKSIYNCIYEYYGEEFTGRVRWSALKNIRLKLTRSVSFDEIIKADLLGLGKNPGRNNQRVLVYEYKNYVWVVPFIVDKKGIFLKTIYPSRKYKKLYRKR